MGTLGHHAPGHRSLGLDIGACLKQAWDMCVSTRLKPPTWARPPLARGVFPPEDRICPSTPENVAAPVGGSRGGKRHRHSSRLVGAHDPSAFMSHSWSTK